MNKDSAISYEQKSWEYAGRITSYTAEGNTFPCWSVQQQEGSFSYCRLEYKEVQAVHWVVFVK